MILTPQEAFITGSLRLYDYDLNNLRIIRKVLNEEISLRQDIRGKEQALELATKVEEATGNDQRLVILRAELHSAKKAYANLLTQYDSYKYMGTKVQIHNDDRLKPMPDFSAEPMSLEDLLLQNSIDDPEPDVILTRQGDYVNVQLVENNKTTDLGEYKDKRN